MGCLRCHLMRTLIQMTYPCRTFALVVLFSQYLRDVSVPVFFTKNKAGSLKRYHLFKVFPVSETLIPVIDHL